MKANDEILKTAIRENVGLWFETYGRIWPKDRSQGLVKPTENYLQRLVSKVVTRMEDLGLPQRVIGLKPRQKGSTTFFAAVDYCHLRRKSAHACVIGGQYSQTREIWEMLRTYQSNDKFDWGNAGEIGATDGNWANGSRLKKETAGDALAGISGTYQVLHATEVARWARYGVSNAAAVLTNILKCVPLLPDTLVVLESTAEGAAGEFHTRYLGAVDAQDFLDGTVELTPGQYVRVFAPWFEFADSAMRLTPEQKKHIQNTLDSEEEYMGERILITKYGRTDDAGVMHLGQTMDEYDVWEQLAWRRWAIRDECQRDLVIFDRDYPHSWQDAFVKSGNMRFNATGLSVLRKGMVKKVGIPGIFEENKGRLGFRQTDRNEAQVIIWEKPEPGRRYLLACDPMTGATQVGGEDPDYHGIPVLRQGYWDNSGKWRKPAVVARVVPCRWDIDVVKEALWKLARYYGPRSGCKIAIEMNMDRGLTELLKLEGADLYQRQVFNQREMKTAPAYGFSTTPKTRENLIETLAKAIREWDTPSEGIEIYDEHIISQLENFVVSMKGTSAASEGHHDDDVLAVALGLHLIEQATTYHPDRMGGDLPPDLRDLVAPQGNAVGGAYS